MKTDNKLKGRDLINVGIYGAIYFVILFAVAMLGMIPIFLPLLSVLVPILGGIPFMLFLTRAKKFGMITIMETRAPMERIPMYNPMRSGRMM